MWGDNMGISYVPCSDAPHGTPKFKSVILKPHLFFNFLFNEACSLFYVCTTVTNLTNKKEHRWIPRVYGKRAIKGRKLERDTVRDLYINEPECLEIHAERCLIDVARASR